MKNSFCKQLRLINQLIYAKTFNELPFTTSTSGDVFASTEIVLFKNLPLLLSVVINNIIYYLAAVV